MDVKKYIRRMDFAMVTNDLVAVHKVNAQCRAENGGRMFTDDEVLAARESNAKLARATMPVERSIGAVADVAMNAV